MFSIESFVEKKGDHYALKIILVSVSPDEEKEALDNVGGLPFAPVAFSSDESEPASKPKSESLEELSSGPVIPIKKSRGPTAINPIETERNEVSFYIYLML